MRSLGTTVALMMLLSSCVGADRVDPEPEADGATLSDAVFADVIADDGPGCAGAVAIDGDVVWSGQSGLADIDADKPITADTRFDIASVSKQFTGFAVLTLVESGELMLNDTVDDLIDGMPSWSTTVTVEHLLTHTSGIVDYGDLLSDDGVELDDITGQDDALTVIADTELEFSPGTRFSYSNSNYVLLASIVEVVTGEDFASVLESSVFGGADLRLEPASTSPDVARSYIDGTESRSEWLQVGDGSIVATPRDVALWGSIYADTDDPVVRAMTSIAVADGEDGGAYGAGIGITDDGTLQHDGAWSGFIAHFQVSPDRSTVIVLTCNSPDLDSDLLVDELTRIWT